MFKKYLLNFTSIFLIFTMLLVSFPQFTIAASVTSFSVLSSRAKSGTDANHTFTFTTPTGVAAGATIILTYDTNSVHNDFDFGDADLKDDGVDVDLVDITPSGTSWGVSQTSASTMRFTNGTNVVAPGSVIEIEVGLHATHGVAGVHQNSNGGISTNKVTLSGTFGDTGVAAMGIVADDQVVIAATVAPTITFTISDNTIEFGALSASQATWADNASGSSTDVAAHTMTVATNSTGGYTVSYNGPTLTSGGDTIAVASVSADANGTPGTEQFGLSISTNGDATIVDGYRHTDPDWTWVASTTTTIFSETGPTNTETFSAYYLANISGATEAGAYSTTTAYVATATF